MLPTNLKPSALSAFDIASDCELVVGISCQVFAKGPLNVLPSVKDHRKSEKEPSWFMISR